MIACGLTADEYPDSKFRQKVDQLSVAIGLLKFSAMGCIVH
jgi:hypothetical protein